MDSEVLASTEPATKTDPRLESQIPSSRWLDLIFSIILMVIHFVFRQYLFYHRWISYIYHRGASLWENHYQVSLTKLKNIPTNVALGINTRKLNYEKLAQMIEWCRKVPTIRTVTIYHPYTAADENGPIELKQLIPESTEHFTVSLLPFSAGRQSLVNAARHFAADSTLKGPITQEMITEYLKRDYPNPDPDLLLVFGDCQIYNGFPCWQIRLTETVFMPPLDWVTLSMFYQALLVYSKCEQRFGK